MLLSAEERFVLLLKKGIRGLLEEEGLLKVEPSHVRFVIGGAYGDIKIPFIIGGKDIEIIMEALFEFAFYIKNRVEGKRPEELTDLLSRRLSNPLHPLPHLTYRGPMGEESHFKEDLITALLFSIPPLDISLL